MNLLETLLSPSGRAVERRRRLTVVRAATYVQGAVEVEELEGGWCRPWRFSAAQRQALGSCMAWHPGIFKQMATTSAGMCLRFETDASEMVMGVRPDVEPRATAAVLAPIDAGGPRLPHDGFSVTVDGRRLGCWMPEPLPKPLYWREDRANMALLSFALDGRAAHDATDPDEADVRDAQPLGASHEVCVWLPCLRGCVLSELWCDGTYVRPMPARRRLLVLGDSIGQGFVCEDPARSWPALLADAWGLELCNQSVGAQVFQPSQLEGARVDNVAVVVVALGANYRWDPCDPAVASRDARTFLGGVRARWPKAGLLVLTPPWHDEDASPSRPGSCWRQVGCIVGEAARSLPTDASYDPVGVLDGLDLLGADPSMFADAEHPNARGNETLAQAIATSWHGLA